MDASFLFRKRLAEMPGKYINIEEEIQVIAECKEEVKNIKPRTTTFYLFIQ